MKLEKKKSTSFHPYLMPKHFRLSRVIYIWAQTKLEKVEPRGKNRVCESYEQMEGGFYFLIRGLFRMEIGM